MLRNAYFHGRLNTMLATLKPTQMPVEVFKKDLFQICGNFNVITKNKTNTLRGSLQGFERGGLDITRIGADFHQVNRTQKIIKQDSGENYFLILQDTGRALMSQNDTTRMIDPGDMILIDSAQPSAFTFFGNFGRHISIHLPRADLKERFGEKAQGGLVMSKADPITTAISAVVAKSFQEATNQDQKNSLRDAVYGLVGAMLYERTGDTNLNSAQMDISNAHIYSQTLRYIEGHLKDPDLNVQMIAQVLQTSPRQLQREFAATGTTPTAYIRQKRLEQACNMLVERKKSQSEVQISSIAFATGFNDISYFNRVFREAFGCAPGQYAQK